MGNDSPGCAATDLHEIHLARQSSLQVPVGHITVPGGIKLCSPGTFLVANYLIINNGSYQVNFTKPNRAAIRFTNSQWLREDATELPLGRVAVPKTGQKNALPREDATEASVGRVAVPKGRWMTVSPRGAASEPSVSWSPCRRPVMTPERNRFETGWVKVRHAGLPPNASYSRQEKFFYRADACCKRFH